MRIPSLYRDRKSLELQLTPMIDCVFLLMIYFLWSSSFAVVEMSLPSTLAAQNAGSGPGRSNQRPSPEADFDKIVIRVLRDGIAPAWQVNDSPIASLAELRRTLMAIANIKRDAPVVIDPIGDVPLGEVIDVFDITRLAGFQEVQFAAEM